MDNYAVVKIGYSQKDSMIRVSLDEKNTGNFHPCFVEHAEFAPEWWRTAHLGISSSTGQLADNHDILSVETVEGEGDPDKVSVSPSRAAAKLEEEENSAFQAMMAKRSVNPAAADGGGDEPGEGDGGDGPAPAVGRVVVEARAGAPHRGGGGVR